MQAKAERSVAARDNYDDDEIYSKTVSRATNIVRARDKSPELKNIKSTYPNKLGNTISTQFG